MSGKPPGYVVADPAQWLQIVYYAILAQLVEHSFRKAGVRSSILRDGSTRDIIYSMQKNTDAIQKEIEELEVSMQSVDFWSDKIKAQYVIKKIADLKDELLGNERYDNGSAVLSIISGAGGDDAEDFARMLLDMYTKFLNKKGFSLSLVHENTNDHGGYRNVSINIDGKGVYGLLKNENGVHRLVRNSPFNAKAKRSTSFALVEVVPKIGKAAMPELLDKDIDFDFAKSGGPGGQNVNKRETAVRVTHIPTGLTAHSREERTQEANRERALEILRGKLFKKAADENKTLVESMQSTKNTEIEWGNQIRNYVLHPYKLVKDLRTGFETSNVDSVLVDGELEALIQSQKEV